MGDARSWRQENFFDALDCRQRDHQHEIDLCFAFGNKACKRRSHWHVWDPNQRVGCRVACNADARRLRKSGYWLEPLASAPTKGWRAKWVAGTPNVKPVATQKWLDERLSELLDEATEFFRRLAANDHLLSQKEIDAARALSRRFTHAATVDRQPALAILPYATACRRIASASAEPDPNIRRNEAIAAVSMWQRQSSPDRYTPIV